MGIFSPKPLLYVGLIINNGLYIIMENIFMEKMGLTWINHRDGSKHVKTYEEIIFGGMNIHISQHIPAILGQQRGTRVLTHTQI
jgi:hypothetical protein